MLPVAVVVHEDRAGADVAAGADLRIAEIGEVVGLRAPPDRRGLELDEVADMHVVAYVRARPQAGKRTYNCALADPRPLDVAEGVDADVAGDRHAGAEAHVGTDRD